MKIEYPPNELPMSGSTRSKVGDHILNLNYYFRDEVFDNTYYPQLRWFKEEVRSSSKILSLGCGAGRETFALLWELGAGEAVGIDINHKKIKDAKRFTQIIQELTDFVQQTGKTYKICNNKARHWREKVLDEIRDWSSPALVDT